MEKTKRSRAPFGGLTVGLACLVSLLFFGVATAGASWIRDGASLAGGGETVIAPTSALYLPSGGDPRLIRGNLTLEVREWTDAEPPNNVTHEMVSGLLCLSAYECCHQGPGGTIVHNRHRYPTRVWVIPRNFCGVTPLRSLLFVLPAIFVCVALVSAWIHWRRRDGKAWDALSTSYRSPGEQERTVTHENRRASDDSDLEDGGVSMTYVVNPSPQRRIVHGGNNGNDR